MLRYRTYINYYSPWASGLWGRYYYPSFKDEDMKTQGGSVTCQPHGKSAFRQRAIWLPARASSTAPHCSPRFQKVFATSNGLAISIVFFTLILVLILLPSGLPSFLPSRKYSFFLWSKYPYLLASSQKLKPSKLTWGIMALVHPMGI